MTKVGQLAQLRRTNMALIYGEYIPIEVTDNMLHFQRIYLDNIVDVHLCLDGESSIAINGEKVFIL